MKPVRITCRNYRGFSEESPLQIEIGPGFTAIVGRNNSGKSAAKLFFYEFRRLFETLTHPFGRVPGITNAFGKGPLHIDYLDVTDPEEVFNNANNRAATIQIELLDPPPAPSLMEDQLVKIVARCDRVNPNAWVLSAFGGFEPGLDLGTVEETNSSGTYRGMRGRRVNCSDFMGAMAALRDAKYYGPFRNAINQGAGNYYDLKVGTAFIDLWNEWKTSGVKQQSKAIDQVTEDIRKLFEFERLEITASAKLQTLVVNVDGQPHRLGELGSGLSQFIMVLGNAAATSPSLLLIDEPETHLHPALQIDFLTLLGRYARNGVVFSTHSIGLARSVAPRIYSIQKRSGQSVIRRFEATPNYLEFVGELSFSTFKDFGSDRILLVEGVNDVLVVQQLLRLIGKDHTTVILPLGGDQLASGREAELAELARLSSNVSALVDSERESAAREPAARRVQFEEACKKIGIKVCLTQRRAIENYFVERAVQTAFGASFHALTAYQALKEAATPWRKVENWKVAGYMKWSDIESTDVGQFLTSI